MPKLSDEQIEILLRPVHPSRVERTPNGMSHLQAHDVIAHLTRKFGFEGWDKEIISLDLIRDGPVTWKTRDGIEKSGYDALYRCMMRLIIRDLDGEVVKTIEDAATGDAAHQQSYADAHDLALKSAVSGALKRCAKDLGDQFGLSLYDKGSTQSVVQTVPGRNTHQFVPSEITEKDTIEGFEWTDAYGKVTIDSSSLITEDPGPASQRLAERVEHIAHSARRYLEVPFKDKDRVKALGARWDAEAKSWYVPVEKDAAAFAQWLEPVTEEPPLFDPPDEEPF